MRKISFIIVTYNSIEFIKDCIDSILKFNDIGIEYIEIIIVDNSDLEASQELFEYIRKIYDDKIIFIKNKLNLGYGQGNNVGINIAIGEILCIMNPDVRFSQPLLKVVLQEYNSSISLCLLGFKQIGGSNLSYYLKPQHYFGPLSAFIVKMANWFNVFNENYFALSGALFFIDKCKFDKIGRFDENIFMYCEESDISNRILQNDYSIKFIKDYSYIHLVGERKTFSDFSINIGQISLNYYLSKFGINQKKYFKKKYLDLKFHLLLAIILRNKLKTEKIKNQLTDIKNHL